VVGEISKAAAGNCGEVQARSTDAAHGGRTPASSGELLGGRDLNGNLAVTDLGVAVVETTVFALVGGGGRLSDGFAAGDGGWLFGQFAAAL